MQSNVVHQTYFGRFKILLKSLTDDTATAKNVRSLFNKINKLPSAQLVSVITLIWQHVSTSEGHL